MVPFLAKPRPYDPDLGPVVAGHIDSNSALIADAARLYIPDGALVLDATYGKGVFWKDVDRTRFYLVTNDKFVPEANHHHDFRNLTFRDDFWDIVVLDPPYKSGGKTSHESMVERYGLDALESDTPSKHGNVTVLRKLYRDGMTECARVLRPGGLLWVKCQDMVESGRQHWLHMEIPGYGETIGLTPKDLFVLTNASRPMMRHKSQHHARKNVSYLWVLQKWV
jgi:hypothetical protein